MVNIELKIPEDWFKEQYVSGFLVTKQMKEVRAIQLDMLYKLQQICEKHNIKWWIDSGTLLGAVRHKGFIPWDDDIDVVMFREDYDKFNEVAIKELSEPYFIQNDFTDECFYFHTKIRRSDTTGIILKNDKIRKNNTFNQGIFIDIFPLDYVYDENEEIKYKNYIEYLILLKKEILIKSKRAFFTQKKNEKVYKECVELRKIYEKYRKTYNGVKFNVVANLSLPSHKQEIRKRKEEFDKTIYMDFEMLKVPAPYGYKTILERLYGDYMEEVQSPSQHGEIYFDTNTTYKKYIESNE